MRQGVPSKRVQIRQKGTPARTRPLAYSLLVRLHGEANEPANCCTRQPEEHGHSQCVSSTKCTDQGGDADGPKSLAEIVEERECGKGEACMSTRQVLGVVYGWIYKKHTTATAAPSAD